VIFRNQKGQMTGELKDGIYEQRLRRKMHSFHSQGALAIDTVHLASLRQLGASQVRKIFDNGETFTATIEDFTEHGYEKQWTSEDGMQTFLAERFWIYRNEAQMALF
jgi:hypothetical protein